MNNRTYPLQDRWSYLWLVLGTLLGLLTYGEWLIPVVVWLSPIFTLRFLRTQPTLRGFALAVAATIPMLHVLLNGVVPIPGIGFTIFVVIATVMAMLPYLADRLLVPRLPALAGTLVFPLAMTSMEYINAMGEWGTWGAQAYTQAGNLPLIQLVSVTGMWGITLLINWLPPLVNWAWEQGWAWSRVRSGALLYAGLLAVVLFFGTLRLATADTTGTVRVAGIPGSGTNLINISDTHPELTARLYSKSGPSKADRAALRGLFAKNYEELLARTEAEAQAGAKIVFWAEGNGTVLAEDEATLLERGRTVAREQRIYLGMAIAVLTPGTERPLENKIVLVEPSGEIAYEYIKAFPVPGGEAQGSVRGVADIPTIDTPYGRIGSVICFDMDHHAYIQQAGQKGIDILFAPANTWQKVAQTHADMATFRAIENGVTVVRPASNGLSLAAAPTGRVLAQSNYWQSDAGAVVASVPTQRVPTLYSVIGDAFAYLALAGFLFLIGWAVVRSRRAPAAQPAPQVAG